MNSCLLEFESDGFRVVTSRNAIRRVEMITPAPQSDAPGLLEHSQWLLFP